MEQNFRNLLEIFHLIWPPDEEKNTRPTLASNLWICFLTPLQPPKLILLHLTERGTVHTINIFYSLPPPPQTICSTKARSSNRLTKGKKNSSRVRSDPTKWAIKLACPCSSSSQWIGWRRWIVRN